MRELRLCRVLPGEGRILASGCLPGHMARRARGVAGTDVVALPPRGVHGAAVFTARA